MVTMAGIPVRLPLMETGRNVSPARSSGLLLVAVAWAATLVLSGSPEAILFTIPVFLLVAPLAIGRYVGEDLIGLLRSAKVRTCTSDPILALPGRVESGSGIIRPGLLSARGPPFPGF